MRASIYSVFVKAILLCAGLSFHAAQATVINFDDLKYVIDEYGDGDQFDDHPVTDEYLSKGLYISGGYLAEYPIYDSNIVSAPNLLIISRESNFYFIGELPTFVSMRVNGSGYNAMIFDVYGSSGLLYETKSSGDANSPDDPPAIPNELMTFSSLTGIASIHMNNFYDWQIAGTVDDLTYEYASVPEPSALILLGIGFLGIVLRRRVTK